MKSEFKGLDKMFKVLKEMRKNFDAVSSNPEEIPMEKGVDLASDAMSAYADALLKAKDEGDKGKEAQIMKEIRDEYGKEFSTEEFNKKILERAVHKFANRIIPEQR